MYECSPDVPLGEGAGCPRLRATTLDLAFVQVSGGRGIRTHGDASTPQRFSRALTTVFQRPHAFILVSSSQVRGVLTSMLTPGDPPLDLHECSASVLLRGVRMSGMAASATRWAYHLP